jgi:hypothetical protein
MMIEYIAAIALAGVLILGMAGPTFSANGEVQEETALLRTKLTLSQAISTAEQQTGGRAGPFSTASNIGSFQTARRRCLPLSLASST